MKAPSPSRPQRKVGKASGFRSARQFPWTKEEDALLGRLTDRDVAEKLNRTLGGVRDRRKFLGKPAVGHAPQSFRMEREPHNHYARLFAAKSDQEVRAMLASRYKCIRTRRRQLAGGKVRNGRWRMIVWWEMKSDHVLVRKFGRPVGAVRHRRARRSQLRPMFGGMETAL